MKKLVATAIAVLVLFMVLPRLTAQESAYDVEGWKKRVASPTYGLTVAVLEYEDSEGGNETHIAVPGVELRIFNGTNVAKRGGFFTGYEVGTVFFYLPETEELSATDYNVDPPGSIPISFKNLTLNTAFIMSKYGYRLDLGVKAVGLSVGAELGIGLQTSIGGVDVYSIDAEDSDYIDAGIPFSVILDGAVEAAFRLGQNFRLFGRVGSLLIPPMLSFEDASFDDGSHADFDAEMFPVMLSARLGFALNY